MLCSMINKNKLKNAETEIGVKPEGQESKTLSQNPK